MRETPIEWTDYSHNFWMGCRKVSPGCKFCYAERDMETYNRDFATVTRTKGFADPLRDKWGAGTVFVNSWSDFFIEDADPWRPEAWDIIGQTPHLTYLILTKRIENVADRLPANWGDGWENVWLGVSAENQKYADIRIPTLLETPAAHRFISAEPLLGRINLNKAWIYYNARNPGRNNWDGLDWVITGGESGRTARPSDPRWFRWLRDQCNKAEIMFNFKQWGEWLPESRYDGVGRKIQEAHLDVDGKLTSKDSSGYLTTMYRVGKQRAGRELDGVKWDQKPRASTKKLQPNLL